MALNFRFLSALDNPVQHGLAVVGQLCGGHFHDLKIPILPIPASSLSPARDRIPPPRGEWATRPAPLSSSLVPALVVLPHNIEQEPEPSTTSGHETKHR